MAATQKKNIWFLSSPDGTPPPIRTYEYGGGGEVAMPGSPVLIAADGQVDFVADQGTTMLGYLVGVVDKSKAWPLTAALSAGDEVRVAIARPGDLWACYCDSAGSDTTVAVSNIGDVIDITVGAESGYVGYVTGDKATSVGDMFTVVDVMFQREPEKFAAADSPGVLIVKHSGTLQG
mgnify:FL=1